MDDQKLGNTGRMGQTSTPPQTTSPLSVAKTELALGSYACTITSVVNWSMQSGEEVLVEPTAWCDQLAAIETRYFETHWSPGVAASPDKRSPRVAAADLQQGSLPTSRELIYGYLDGMIFATATLGSPIWSTCTRAACRSCWWCARSAPTSSTPWRSTMCTSAPKQPGICMSWDTAGSAW